MADQPQPQLQPHQSCCSRRPQPVLEFEPCGYSGKDMLRKPTNEVKVERLQSAVVQTNSLSIRKRKRRRERSDKTKRRKTTASIIMAPGLLLIIITISLIASIETTTKVISDNSGKNNISQSYSVRPENTEDAVDWLTGVSQDLDAGPPAFADERLPVIESYETEDDQDDEQELVKRQRSRVSAMVEPGEENGDDDDLFLVKGSGIYLSRAERLAASLRVRRETRHLPAAEAMSRLLSEQVKTIYFGGFFPWLTDENRSARGSIGGATIRPPAKSNKSSGNSQRSATSARNLAPQTSSSASPGNGETQLQRNSQAAQAKATTQLAQQQQQQQQKHHQHLRKNNQLQYENGTLPAQAPPATQASQTSSTAVAPSGSHNQLGRFILPAVRLALDHINTNTSVLGSYKLEIVPRDTQCNATISLKEFFDMVYEEPKKMLLYGDACRVSTDPIAKASYFFDLIQISYADTDPIYTIENYPNFFRVVPSENALSLARIPFIRHFNWTRVGTIYQNLPRYSLPHSKLLTDLERFNIVIKQSVSLPGSVDGLQNRDLGDELRKLKEKDVRIILGNFDEEWGLLLFCEAFRERMTGRKYQWILTGMNADKLWRHFKTKGSSCSEQELLIAMDGYITTDITPVTRSQHRTISGMMAHEYSNEYRRRAEEMSISIEENKFYGYVYDGIWAIALALHRVDHQLRYYQQLAATGKVQLLPEMEGLNSLLDFDYHKPIWVKLIRNALNKTRFDGVTGTVSFVKNERPGLISFSQFQAHRDSSEVVIGSYDALNDNLDLKVGFPIFWRGPSPPIDYTIERVKPFRINRTLFVIVSILALFGIVLAFIFLFINIKFRDQRYIKMSSPYLNNLIIIGCILTYTSVIILGLDSGLTSEYNFHHICNARAWVLMAGFTLAFGSMFSKTFRVHSIFTNIKLHKKVIKDYKLFMVVFILLTFDICILVVWQYFDPFYRETNNGTSIQDSDNEDIIIVPEMEHCQSKRMTIFLSVIYVYKGLLMAFGCFLAWETRHVSIPALNDSKYIGLSVYNVVIMCVIGAGLSFVLRDQQDASFVIISIFIIFCSTTTLCLVFVPKLIELKQNPRAGDHRVRATLKTFKKNYQEEAFGAAAAGCRDIHGNFIGRGHGANLGERIKLLHEENVKNRVVLKEKTYELEALTYKYRKIQSMIQSGQYFQALSATIGSGAIGSGDPLTPVLNPMPSSSITTNLPTTVMLTSRSPTQERGSFSLLNKDGKVDPQGFKASSAMTPASMKSVTDNTLGSNLAKSPLMFSSSTQITTTNTTSSTNNNTDLTADYLTSSRLTTTNSVDTKSNSINSMTKLQADGGKRALVVAIDQGFKNDDLSKEADELLNNFVASGDQDLDKSRSNYAKNLARDNLLSSGDCAKASLRNKKHKAVDSSYCPMGDGGDAVIRGGVASGPHDDEVFTVFSYAANKSNGSSRSSRRGQAEVNFNRWSEGPFCALMVKSKQQQQQRNKKIPMAPGKAVRRRNQQDSSEQDNRASCPDIAAKRQQQDQQLAGHKGRGNHPRKQLSQQVDRYKTQTRPAPAASGAKLTQLPRTISMIEYLGLDEFDLLAKRHDKLLRQQENQYRRTAEATCCNYDLPPMTTECAYCAADIHHQQQQLYRLQKQHSTTKNKNFNHSNVDMLSEPLTSADLIQSSSQLSCSTCCSLASRSYISHSDIYDRSSSATSSGGAGSSGELPYSQPISGFSASGSRYLSHSHVGSTDGSSKSTVDEISLGGALKCSHLNEQKHLSGSHGHLQTSATGPCQHQVTHSPRSTCTNDTTDINFCSSDKQAQSNLATASDTIVCETAKELDENLDVDNGERQNFSIKCDVLENL